MSLSLKHAKSTVNIILVTAVAVGSVVLIAFLARRDTGAETGYRSPTRYAMDTTLDVTIQAVPDDKAEALSEEAYRLALRLESYTSRFDRDSDVWKINENAGISPVEVHPETLEMVERSIEFSRLTDGAFDITVAPVSELWGFYDREHRVPSESEISEALELVDWRRIKVDRDACTIFLEQKGMEIDLGGVAKGYAVKAMRELLADKGVEHGLVNFGGAVGTIGTREDGEPWMVGIRSPRGEPQELIGELEIVDCYVASSGDYERYFVEDGRRYCHIFDPRSGYPPDHVWGDTIVGPDPMNADIISTSVFVLGAEEGLRFVESMEGYSSVVIDYNGEVMQTPGMSDYVSTIKERI